MTQPADKVSNTEGTSAQFFRIGKNGIVVHNRGTGSPPTNPVPQDGDLYFEITTGVLFFYDAGRSKWLSTESYVLQSGRNGNTGNNGFYRGVNGLVLNANRGWPAFFDGTIVGLGYTRDDTDNANFQILAAGSVITTVNSTSRSAVINTLDDDFDQGQILAFRNSGNTTSNVQIWARIKWRIT